MKLTNLFIALALIICGALMLANNYGLLDLSWIHSIEFRKFLWPAIIIIIGFKLLSNAVKTNDKRGNKDNMQEIPVSNDCEVVLCGRSMNFNGQRFEGLRVKALMGGAKIDLRGAEISENATIIVNSLFGGVEILLSNDVSLDIKSHCFMGGVNDERTNVAYALNKKIVIEASCMLGGVSIKN